MSDKYPTTRNPYSIEKLTKQDGKNNVNVDNQPGGIVNFNFNFPQSTTTNPAELMMAVHSFSKEYYQLLVTSEEDVFKNDYVTVSKSRALSQYLVPPEILERCSSLSEEGIAELKSFPAIVCKENTQTNGITDPNQLAMYSYITIVKNESNCIKVGFQPIKPFSQTLMCIKKNALYFNLDMDCAITDLNHSAWSVHKVNLFTAFTKAGIADMPQPE